MNRPQSSMPGATRHFAPETSEGAYAHTCDTPEAMARCLSCEIPQEDCKGNCKGTRREYKRKKGARKPGRPVTIPTSDPCPTCYSRAVCAAYKGTCAERGRWEGTG